MINFCFSTFIINLWQLCLLLFYVHKNIKSYSVYLDKNSPLIYGPIVFNLNFWTNSPSMFNMPKQPYSLIDLKSKSEVIRNPEVDTQRDVGPNRPLNWWKTLKYNLQVPHVVNTFFWLIKSKNSIKPSFSNEKYFLIMRKSESTGTLKAS